MAWVATAVVGSAVIGGAVQAYSANRASNAQQRAAGQAAQTALGMYNTTRGDLEPYRNLGSQAAGTMSSKLDDLIAPISLNLNDIENSDYYKFANYQGNKAAQNSAAARGLGTSGAALKGATAFSQGLATSTYKDVWNMENTNKTNAYNRLKGLIDVGNDAAKATGSAGTAAANTASSAQIGAGNAEAAGINAMGSAISGAVNNIGGYYGYRGMYGNGNNAGGGEQWANGYNVTNTGGVNPFPTPV